MRFVFVIVLSLISSTPASAQYYGEFLDELVASFNVSTVEDWTTITLLQDYRFHDPNTLIWTTLATYTVNGASIPRWAWPFVGSPYTGKYLPASVIHDYYVDKKTRTAHDTHRNFYYGMLANGVYWAKAKAMHWAVSFYTDWDINNPENAIRIEPTTSKSAAELMAVIRAIESSFVLEAQALVQGNPPFPQYDLDSIERDAKSFRDAITGLTSTKSYSGIATENGIPQIFSSINEGTANFELFKISEQSNNYDRQFQIPGASIGFPTGVLYDITVPKAGLESGLYPFLDEMNDGKYIYVNEGLNPSEQMKAYDSSLIESTANVYLDLFANAGGSDIEVYIKNDEWANGSASRAPMITMIEATPSIADSVIVSANPMSNIAPKAPLAPYREFGTIMSGKFLPDGSFNFKGEASISVIGGN